MAANHEWLRATDRELRTAYCKVNKPKTSRNRSPGSPGPSPRFPLSFARRVDDHVTVQAQHKQPSVSRYSLHDSMAQTNEFSLFEKEKIE